MRHSLMLNWLIKVNVTSKVTIQDPLVLNPNLKVAFILSQCT